MRSAGMGLEDSVTAPKLVGPRLHSDAGTLMHVNHRSTPSAWMIDVAYLILDLSERSQHHPRLESHCQFSTAPALEGSTLSYILRSGIEGFVAKSRAYLEPRQELTKDLKQ